MRLFKSACAIAASVFLFSSAIASAQEIKVTDLRDKNVTLSGPAEKLVIIPIPMSSVVIALDGSIDRIAAMNPIAIKSVTDGFLGKIFPKAADIPSDIIAGGKFTPNVESILALKPDAVIQWKAPEDIIAPLENAGVTVVGLQNNPATQALNERNLTVLATVIGQKERLETFLKLHHKRLEAVKTAVASQNQQAKNKVLYLRHRGGKMTVAGDGTYQDFWIELAGGQNVADELKKLTGTSIEQIVAWNPDVIILSAFDKVTPEAIYANPALAGVDAVKSKKVYKIPHGGYRWDPGSHESFLTWTWAAMLLHPEVSFDLHADMRNAYELFYGHKLTKSEINNILQVDLNSNSAGYERFSAQ